MTHETRIEDCDDAGVNMKGDLHHDPSEVKDTRKKGITVDLMEILGDQ